MLDNSNGKVVVGGKTDEENKYISPTLVVDVKLDDSIMKEEVCDSIYHEFTEPTNHCLLVIKHIFI